MKTKLAIIVFLHFLILNFFSQENATEHKKISLGIIPYEFLGRKSSALLLFEGEKKSFGFSVSYVYPTYFDGTYLLPFMSDRFSYKGFLGDFLVGQNDSKNNTFYFSSGLHYFYYDYAAVTNGKIGDEIGYKAYKNAKKIGPHFSFFFLHALDKKGIIRFFFKPTAYFSYFERTFSSIYYSKYTLPPEFQAEPKLESGLNAEVGVSLGLILAIKLRK